MSVSSSNSADLHPGGALFAARDLKSAADDAKAFFERAAASLDTAGDKASAIKLEDVALDDDDDQRSRSAVPSVSVKSIEPQIASTVNGTNQDKGSPMVSKSKLFEMLGGHTHKAQCVNPGRCSICGLVSATRVEPETGSHTSQTDKPEAEYYRCVCRAATTAELEVHSPNTTHTKYAFLRN
eukprot:SAG31_NODE_6362_length_2043_cov_3.160494_2_plen_182_part_00